MWGNAIKIARLDGFDIKVDASWLLIAALIVWSLATSYFPSQLPDAETVTLVSAAVIGMLGLFASLILHEMSHAIVARRYGLGIYGITLFLFGGVAELQTEPTSGESEFWIAIAGPVASLGLALGFWLCTLIATAAGLADAVLLVLSYLATINLVLALFNLLPAFPMDGGRVLRAWLWSRSGDLLNATRRATAISTGFAYMFMALGLFAAFSGSIAAGLWPVLIGLFLLATSRAALSQIETKAALEGRSVADLMTRAPWTVAPELSLSDLVHTVFIGHGVNFVPVVERNVLLGYVDFQMARKIDREHWENTTVEDVLESTGPDNTVRADMAGRDLLQQMVKTGRRKFLVIDETGLTGVVTLSDVLGFMSVFRDLT